MAVAKKTIAPNVVSTNAELAQVVKDSIQQLIYDKITPEKAAEQIMKDFTAKLGEMKTK